MSKPETALSKEIRDALARRGFWIERVNSGKTRVRRGWLYGASAGTPDILVIAPAFGFLEVKTETGGLNPDQVAWHDKARAFGVRVEVVRSVEGALRTVEQWVAEERAAKGAA